MNATLRKLRRILPRPHRQQGRRRAHGFTLLEVLVALTVLAIGSALTLSLISGSLGNIRKVQLRTRSMEHAREVMETALLDRSIQQPTTFTGDFEDGSHWSVRVEDFEMPVRPESQPGDLARNMPAKLLSYTVEMFRPDSTAPDFRLHTLKLVNKSAQDLQMRVPQ